MNIFNISSIESLSPTQKLGLRGGFETTYRKSFITAGLRLKLFEAEFLIIEKQFTGL